MIVNKPRANERINVSKAELASINAVVDNSAHKWSSPSYVRELFSAANSGNDTWVYLRSEGWHQPERYQGELYQHVTVHYNGWTYHLYSNVSKNKQISSTTHTIDYISYVGSGGYPMNLSPTA